MAKQTFTTGQVLTAAQMTSLQATSMGGGSPSVKTTSYVLVAADAGTVIQMNSASSTTITVNTSLFSAGDSVQIQNIGAGTTTITAGTATVNSAGSLAVSQYDGGFLYFSSASSAIWFDYTQPGTTSPLTTKGDLYTRTSSADSRLAVGANGTTLVADSAEATGLKWATASSGALTYVGGATFSASSAVNVNDVFSSTYNNYVVYTYYTSTASTDIDYRLRVSGADNTTSNYTTQRTNINGSTVTTNRFTVAQWTNYTSTSTGNYVKLEIFAPFQSQITGAQMSLTGNVGTAIEGTTSFHSFNLTTSFTGFSIVPSSGTITGLVKVYGLANS